MPRHLPGPSWWLALAVLAALGAFVAARFELVTGVSHFLPEGTDRELAPLSRELAESELTRTIIITLAADDPDTATDAAAELAERLRTGDTHGALTSVRCGPPEGIENAFYNAWFPHRFAFLAEDPERELPQLLSDDGLRQRLQELTRRLARPGAGALTRALAAQDPLLAFELHLDRIQRAQAAALTIHRGRFLATDPDTGRAYGVVFVTTRASAFDSDAQAPTMAWIDSEIERLQENHEGLAEVETSAVHRFALASERSIRADITRISIASTVGLVLLFLVLLRRPRYLALAVVPLAGGFVVALAATLALFGNVHGLTLAFGASLLGVCIDYPIHLFNHHALDPHSDGPTATVRRLWPGLLLGASTTVAGFSALAWTALPGIRQIAVFASVGIAASLLVTRFVVAPLLPRTSTAAPTQARAANALGALLRSMQRVPAKLVALPLAALLVCAVGLPRLTWVDDPSALNELDPDLLAEEERVRKRISRMESGQLVLATGPDLDTALANNDAVAHVLAQARLDGLVDEYRSLADLLWSPVRQQQNLDAVYGDPALAARLSAALETEGFAPQAFTSLFEELAGPSPGPLRLDTLRADPALAPIVQAFYTTLGDDRVAVVTLLHGLHAPDALAERLEPLGDQVNLFDQQAFLARTYQHVRTRSLEVIGLGLVAVFLMLLARYRSPRLALATFLPSVLAATTTLAVLALAGIAVHILHVVSLLLVLSIGVDYAVFLAEARRHGARELAATLLAVAMACASTVLAFGLLAASAMPALRAIGLATGIGVLLAMALAPTTLVLFRGLVSQGAENP